MRKFILGFAILACSLSGWAQRGRDYSAGEVYLGYSFLNGDTLSKASGFETALMGNVSQHFGLKADLSGNYKSVFGVHGREYNMLFGPQVNSGGDRLNVFGHGLFGVAHFSSDGGPSDTSAGWVLGGGADYKLADHFAWRVAQFDYHGGHVFSTTQDDFRFSTGVLYRF